VATAPEAPHGGAFEPALVRIRQMLPSDVPRVIEIEEATYPFPWSEPIFRDCLRVGYDCHVLETDAGVSGYAVMSIGAGESHVLNLCIDARCRGHGLGRQLLRFLLDRAIRADASVAFLEVRPSNGVAIALYESFGFHRVGVRRGYYQAVGGREDAWVYRLELAPPVTDDEDDA